LRIEQMDAIKARRKGDAFPRSETVALGKGAADLLIANSGEDGGGRDPLIAARLPQSLIDNLGRWAKKENISRSEAIRRLSRSDRRRRAENLASALYRPMLRRSKYRPKMLNSSEVTKIVFARPQLVRLARE
jgi:hypothetical protein